MPNLALVWLLSKWRKGNEKYSNDSMNYSKAEFLHAKLINNGFASFQGNHMLNLNVKSQILNKHIRCIKEFQKEMPSHGSFDFWFCSKWVFY